MRIMFFIGTVELLLSVIGFLYYRYNLPFGRSAAFSLAYLLLTLNSIFSRPISPFLPHFLVKFSAWLDGLWLAFGYYTLIFALIHFIIWLCTKIFSLQLPTAKIACAFLACSLLLVAWGSYRAFHPVVRTEKIFTEKLPQGSSYRMVLVTDIHLGRILGRSYAENLTQRINQLQPDIVLLAGDLLDEKIAYVLEENSLAPLSQIQTRQGIFMAFGNHDYIDTPALWQSMVEKQNITVLRDQSLIVDEKIKITGLNDFSRNRSIESLLQLSGDNKKYYSILIDHQPRKMLAASRAGYDLYVAGHTHTGQLFPNHYITKRMYPLDFGRSEFGPLTAITSGGYGFWGPPVRTEAAPEIVLIELVGK